MWELFSFYRVGLRDGTQVSMLGSKCLHLSAFTSPAPGPVFSTEEHDSQRRRGLQKIPEPQRRLQVWPDQSNLLSLMLSGLPYRLSAPGKRLHHKPCAETFVIQAEIRGPCLSMALPLLVLFACITHPLLHFQGCSLVQLTWDTFTQRPCTPPLCSFPTLSPWAQARLTVAHPLRDV